MLRRSEKAFSLVELILVLGITAAMVVMGFIVYPKVRASRQANYEIQVITAAQANIKAQYTTGDFAGLTVVAANIADIFPSSMQVTTAGVVSDVNITHQFTNSVTVGGSTDVGVANAVAPAQYYRIHYNRVPTDVCIRLAVGAVGAFGAVYVGGTGTVGSTLIQNNFTGTAFNPSAVPAACTQAGGVSMTFVGQ